MSQHDHDHSLELEIDGKDYPVQGRTMTGQELRDLPQPPIGPDRDVYLEVKTGDDVLITPTEVVDLKDGMEFFTTPSRVTPGR